MKNGFERYQLADRVMDALPGIGYTKPTEVQHKVIPLILQRRNVIVEAATGTGKTAAYGLPLLSRIDFNKNNTQVLVLVPGRELAIQVQNALRSFCSHEKLRVEAVYGGMSMARSEEILRKGAQILVAAPGRLKDLLRSGKYDFFWRDIKYLVIDEADKLLDQGFQEILDNLVSNVRNMVQVALFSATISQDVEELIRERFYPLTTIRLSPKEALRNISFNYINVDKGQKQRVLGGLINKKNIDQALIFCRKREEVIDLSNFVRQMGFVAEAYHGLLDQVERAAIMKRFKSKQLNFLIATDLAARGLDIQELPAVINYAFPDDIEVYLHRCGRTGRAGHKGEVFNLIGSKKEEILAQSFHGQWGLKIKEIAVKPIGKDEYRVAEEKIVKMQLSRGKRDKVGAGDIVGFLVNTAGIDAGGIGTIAVYDSYSLVDIPESFFGVLEMIDELKIKGKSLKISVLSQKDIERRSVAVQKKKMGVRDKKNLEDQSVKRKRKK